MGDKAADAHRILGHIHGGRVLDVATGRGGFIGFLAGGLADYDEIIGIELDDSRRSAFEAATVGYRDVQFLQGDFMRAALGPGSFDTAAVSASLHHFDDPLAVLRRMHDLVRPGGWFVVSEMYRDGQTPAQQTEVAVHDWMAAVDTATGGTHRPTFHRSVIIDMFGDLGLADVRGVDRADLEVDPHDPTAIAEIVDMIDRYASKAAGRPELLERIGELRDRLNVVGVQEATILVLVGRLPSTRPNQPPR
jgi:SAM-dependent methyltransferase